jgi:hypothetical protein
MLRSMLRSMLRMVAFRRTTEADGSILWATPSPTMTVDRMLTAALHRWRAERMVMAAMQKRDRHH